MPDEADPNDGQGELLVVATPIGNLEDLTPRAARTLCTVDLVLSEDTRRTGRLLAHVSSEVPQRSVHEHNEAERIPEILRLLSTGARVALVSDAGTPLISDPGYRLVAAAAEAGLRVTPIPGASAVLAALTVAGLPSDRVVFEGFLPRRGAARRERIEGIATQTATSVLFLAPHRASAELEDLVAACGGGRRAVLCRELTKMHEDVRRGDLAALSQGLEAGVRGELTLVLAGATSSGPTTYRDEELVGRVRDLVSTGMTKKAAISEVARGTAVAKRRVYQAVVDAGRAS